jgi:hypothetical protein
MVLLSALPNMCEKLQRYTQKKDVSPSSTIVVVDAPNTYNSVFGKCMSVPHHCGSGSECIFQI